MACSVLLKNSILPLALIFLLINSTLAARWLAESSQLMSFQYHNGRPLLSSELSINLIWYGKFTPVQRTIISDFVDSLASARPETQPSVATWWSSIGRYYPLVNPKKPNSLTASRGNEVIDETYSLGKSLTTKQVEALASSGPQQPNAINVVLTAADVVVEGFCTSSCGTHGSMPVSKMNHNKSRYTYIWVGNSETQCPGQCAWPFHQPIYGPQSPPLVAPNNDVGLDGMVINMASLLAGTVTNPFGNGYFQGPKEAPLEAASACAGVYGKGAYPGYPGELLVDPKSGASYNAYGINGREYLLPALYDPTTTTCSTLT